MLYHRDLTLERWRRFSLVEQLANIGAEVGRALAWQAKGDEEKSQLALQRGLELFDLTIADPRWRRRLKEITRAREVVCDYFFDKNKYSSTPESLDRYFLQFAVASRRRK